MKIGQRLDKRGGGKHVDMCPPSPEFDSLSRRYWRKIVDFCKQPSFMLRTFELFFTHLLAAKFKLQPIELVYSFNLTKTFTKMQNIKMFDCQTLMQVDWLIGSRKVYKKEKLSFCFDFRISLNFFSFSQYDFCTHIFIKNFS